ncbi:MAG: PHP domain-containing protein [Candidatus Bathyarchaeia archaeon]
MIYVDLHVHTTYSLDSSIQPKVLVDRLHSDLRVKAAAVTDHNTVKGYYKVRELAHVYPDILVIPGVEVGTVNGDIVLLGVVEVPPQPWTVESVIDFARERGGLVVAAHPYREFGLGDLVGKYPVDAVEVLNGSCSRQINALAEKLAKTLGLPGVAGSDAHRVDELLTVYNEVQASADLDDVLKAIKGGRLRVIRSETSIHF